MKKVLSFLIILFVLVSCSENDTQKVEKLFVEAQTHYLENDFGTTRLLLDSIHKNFPRQINFRRKADTLSWKITVAEIESELPILNEQLKNECYEAETIAKNFKFIKDEKYQTIGDYEHISMSTAANAGRNYLKPVTDEKGKFSFISTVVGQKLEHRALRATLENLSGETQKAAENDCNSYNDFGVNYETTLFNAENAKDLILFLVQNSDSQIKITLLGKKEFSYNLSKKDLKTFCETFNFSLLLKNIAVNQAKKDKLEREYRYLNEKIGN